jgi:sugar phosphate permease
VNWFERRRATAVALTQSGIAAGGLLTPLVAYALTTAGWRATAFASGIIVIAVGLPLSMVMLHRPEMVGQHVDGVPPEERAAADAEAGASHATSIDFTVREAVRTRAFWLIALGHGSALLVVGAVTLHLSLHLTESLHYSLQQASFVGGALPLMLLAGQLAGGYFGDRFDKRMLCAVCMLGHMLGLLLLAYAVNLWMVLAFIPLHGLAWGVRGPLMTAIRADYFGQRSYGQIMGFSLTITMLGMIGGPLIAGTLADLTGGYQTGFTILAVIAGLGSLFFVFATPPAPPARVAAPAVVAGGTR